MGNRSQKAAKLIILAVALGAAVCILFPPRSGHSGFRAVTYNVHYFRAGVAGIESTLAEIDADVVALQEVSGGSTLPALAHRLGYRYVSSAPYVRCGSTYWVLAIMTRFAILERSEIRLGNSRRALRVVLDVHGRPVEFITLHLTPLAGPSSSRTDIEARSQSRKREIHDLLAWLSEDRPRVILGDFNFLRGLPGFWLDEYKLMGDYTDADGGIFPNNHDTFPIPEETRTALKKSFPDILIPEAITLDYIFYRGLELRDVRTVHGSASDHWPLIAEFLLE